MLDLHLHSSCSDGSDSPEELVALAAAARSASGEALTTIALTDHDTLEGLERAGAAAEAAGLGFLRGCEVSALFEGQSVHLLCYFVPEGPSPLEALLGGLRQDRANRNLELIAKLHAGGIEVSTEALLAKAGSPEGLGRPHFAEVLVELGHASSIQDAFDRFLADGGPFYVSKAHLAPRAVAEAAHQSGAVCVAAHPLRNKGWTGSVLEQKLTTLRTEGIDGVEVYYGSWSPEQITEVGHLAERLGMVATGGSDYHGSKKPDLSIGTGRGALMVPDQLLEALEAARPAR